jgi:hypothetical protein
MFEPPERQFYERIAAEYRPWLTAGAYGGITLATFGGLSMAGCFNLPNAPLFMWAGATILLACGIAALIFRDITTSAALNPFNSTKNTSTFLIVETVSAMSAVAIASYITYQLLVKQNSVSQMLSLSSRLDLALLASLILYTLCAAVIAAMHIVPLKKYLEAKNDVSTAKPQSLLWKKYKLAVIQAPQVMGAGIVTGGIVSQNIPALIAGTSLIVFGLILDAYLIANQTKKHYRSLFLKGSSFFAAGSAVAGGFLLSQYIKHQSLSFSSGSTIGLLVCTSLMLAAGLLSFFADGWATKYLGKFDKSEQNEGIVAPEDSIYRDRQQTSKYDRISITQEDQNPPSRSASIS